MMNADVLLLNLDLPRDHFHININQSLALNQIWGIMGASGCGKTSLLRCLAGLESGVTGQIVCNGMTWLDTDQGVFIPPERRGIGYIFQEARLFPHLDVMGNLEFARRRANKSQTALAFEEVIAQVDIDHLLGRSVNRLSGGERQRVAIARTLLNAPDLLLMDEPLASLDWPSRLSIMPCLKQIHRQFGIPVIMVSHAREELARLADNLLVMHQGRVVESGRCCEVINCVHDKGVDRTPLSTLNGIITRHDTRFGLTEVTVDGHTVQVSLQEQPEGSLVRLVLPAHEVSLVLGKINNTSIQNRLPVTISAINRQGHHHSVVALQLGSQTLLAQITQKSLSSLALKAGQPIYALFKASGLEVI